jgi:hypothetical protein
VAESPDIAFATFSERLEGGRTLPRVHAGSWIYGSFSTWMGHPEKNRAWELLERTRCQLEDRQAELDPEARRLAWQEIQVAEGSDWYWWLGDDHFSPIAGEFDELFRLHLMNVYRLLGIEPPQDLHLPIKAGGRRGLLERPVGRLSPVIDGEVSSFLEWFSAGLFDLGYDSGAMQRADRRLRSLRFGVDEERLFLCLEGKGGLTDLRGSGLLLEVDALGARKLRVRFCLDVEGGSPEVVDGEAKPNDLSFAWNRVAEVRLPLEALGAGPGRDVHLKFHLYRGTDLLERAPLYHVARLPLPKDYDLECWTA